MDDSQCDFTKAKLTNLVAFYDEHLPVTKGRLTTRKLDRDYLQRPVVIEPEGMSFEEGEISIKYYAEILS